MYEYQEYPKWVSNGTIEKIVEDEKEELDFLKTGEVKNDANKDNVQRPDKKSANVNRSARTGRESK